MTTITLCLTFAPERKKIEIDDTTTTLEQLYDIVRTTFGISADINCITLRHGYPSIALPKLNADGGGKNDNDDKKTKSLSDLNIRNQDRIIVSVSTASTTPVAVPAVTTSAATKTSAAPSAPVVKQQPRQKENKKPPPSSSLASRSSIPSSSSSSSLASRGTSKNCIPGLTKNHYVKDSRNAVGTPPICISSQVDNSTQSFDFRWKAVGSNGSSFYQLSAEGNLSTNSGNRRLIVKCSCPAFTKMGPRSASTTSTTTTIPVKVCKHLSAALDNSLDPTTTSAHNGSSSNNNKSVVDLLSDSDTDVEEQNNMGGGGRRRQLLNPYNDNNNNAKKRTASEPVSTAAKQPTVKKIKKLHSFQSATSSSSTTSGGSATESPIKLLATPQDLQLRRSITDKSHGCWSQCQTLHELVFGNTNDATTTSGSSSSSPQWMVVSNYLIDFNYLQRQLPELWKIPKVLIVHSQHVPSPRNWPTSIDFIQRNPGADAKSTMNPLQYKFDYGTHHTKLFLVGYHHKIRVVVSTANLRPDDCQKAQAMYVEEFPLAINDNETSDFEETLIHYISSYGYEKKRNWLDAACRESLTDTLARYDYSSAKAILIPSIPGYHSIDNRTPRVGQLKVREAIQNYTSKSTSTSTPRPVVCQFSSIGTLSDKYLHSLQTSMDTCLARNERRGQSLQLKFVYPTVEEIRTSVEGYPGGDSVPGRKKCVSKPLLRSFWYKWAGSKGDHNYSTNPLTKPNNVPHIKTYYQTNATSDGFDWLVITSHNISQTAWGTIGDNRHGGGQRLYIRSWELGVFVSPQTLGVDKLVVWSGPGNKLGDAGSTATVPMPYATHSLERYASSDQPWACDEHYLIPDRFGFRSCMGY